MKQISYDSAVQLIYQYTDKLAKEGKLNKKEDNFSIFCKRHGSEIVVVNNPKSSPDRELADDLVSIIHVFSCRLYGLRRYKSKIEKDPNLKGGDNK